MIPGAPPQGVSGRDRHIPLRRGPSDRRGAGTRPPRGHENRDIPAQARISRVYTTPGSRASAIRAPPGDCVGHIFLEAEENDTWFAGRSSGSGSSRRAPSQLSPMASCAPLAHTAAVLSGILTPFPFDPASAGTCEFPDIQLSTPNCSTFAPICKYKKLNMKGS